MELAPAVTEAKQAHAPTLLHLHHLRRLRYNTNQNDLNDGHHRSRFTREARSQGRERRGRRRRRAEEAKDRLLCEHPRQYIATIKSILGDIQDPSIKAALERIVKNPFAVPMKKDAAAIAKLTDQTIRTVQKLINEKLKWTNSFRNLRDGKVKGGRVEVVCQEAEVFERIFKGAAIKGTNSKLSCSAKTDEEARKWDLPFQGKSYRYDSSHLHAPYSACLKDGTLTFSFKFSLEW